MARERAGAGARCVHENAAELAAEGQRARRIDLGQLHIGQPQPRELGSHGVQAVEVAIGGDDSSGFPGRADQRRSLSAGRGAEIEHAIAFANGEQQRNRLRRLVLNGDLPGAKHGRAHRAAAGYGKCGFEQHARFDAQAIFSEVADDLIPLVEKWRARRS